jgi:hypothetical protein
MRWVGHAACMGERSDAHRDLVRKPEARRPLGTPSHSWKDNTKMYVQEVG